MKFIIRWNANGNGDEYEIVEAPNSGGASRMAYEKWKEASEENADYGEEEYTEELAEIYDLD